jgi:hypothetical protein
MSYASSGLTQATDYNGFISTNTPNVNAIWSTGTGNSGYGQTALATISADSLIFASSWLNLINTIGTSASHQGTSLSSYLDSTPTIGDLIRYESVLSSNINAINTNRLNAAAQGSTSSTTATSASTWSNSLTITFTVTYANANSARYFFNAGGQIGFNFSHPAGSGTTINLRINDLCSDAGTVWLSSPVTGTVSLAGTAYNGVTKSGGANPSGATISTNNGFYALTSGTTQLFQQTSDIGVYTSYSGTFLRISASNNGAGVLTFTCLLDEVPNGATVSTGTQATLTLRPPSTTYLTNSWGSPAVAHSIVAT